MNSALWHSFHTMRRTQPLITPEELQCLLGAAPAIATADAPPHPLHTTHTVHFGAALWLLKGLLLYWSLVSPEASSLASASRYLWMRGSLELVCLLVFWVAAVHPRGRKMAHGAMLVASTTSLMDLMTLLSFP